MNTTLLSGPQGLGSLAAASAADGRFVEPTEFCNLMVSHRRMVRDDRREARVRGLRDLDTGEVFLTDERRLLDARR